MTTLEEKIITAKKLGIKFELRPILKGRKDEEYDVMQFYECWTDEEFEKFLDVKLASHTRIKFIRLLQEYDVLINQQLII